MFWCLLTEPILKYLGTQLVVQSVPAHKQSRPIAALRKLFVCREGFLCNRVRMSYLWETFSPVCKVSHDTFLLQRHKKVSGAEPERQDVMMSPDFGGCSFERLPVVYREPHALSRTRVLPLDHRVRTDRADHKSWAARERGTTLLSRDVLRVTWPAQLAREQGVHHSILCRRLLGIQDKIG